MFNQVDNDTLVANESSPLLEVSLELVAPELGWKAPKANKIFGKSGILSLKSSELSHALRLFRSLSQTVPFVYL